MRNIAVKAHDKATKFTSNAADDVSKITSKGTMTLISAGAFGNGTSHASHERKEENHGKVSADSVAGKKLFLFRIYVLFVRIIAKFCCSFRRVTSFSFADNEPLSRLRDEIGKVGTREFPSRCFIKVSSSLTFRNRCSAIQEIFVPHGRNISATLKYHASSGYGPGRHEELQKI